jgi:hypothetical protein
MQEIAFEEVPIAATPTRCSVHPGTLDTQRKIPSVIQEDNAFREKNVLLFITRYENGLDIWSGLPLSPETLNRN